MSSFPAEVRRRVGGALWEAQYRDRTQSGLCETASGIRRCRVLEIVDDFDGDTFRAVYTVRFTKTVYVLHTFQKKSKRGIATPKVELDLIEQRLRRAREDYERWSKSEKPKSR